MSNYAAEADQAAAAGRLPAAVELLEKACEAEPGDLSLWLRLGALRRATGQPAKALEAVNRALALSEFDFMALTMKASLTEVLAPERAGEAWARAIVQRPDGDLPPQVSQALAKGEVLKDRWIAGREEKLVSATASLAGKASA